MSALVPKVTRELTRMKRTLRDVFNLDKLRPGQAEIIRSVLEGEWLKRFRKVRVVLSLLKELNLVKELRGSHFGLLRADVQRSELEELARMSEEKVEKDKEKLERMMQYGQNVRCAAGVCCTTTLEKRWKKSAAARATTAFIPSKSRSSSRRDLHQ